MNPLTFLFYRSALHALQARKSKMDGQIYSMHVKRSGKRFGGSVGR